jgi:hypothetical protein
LQTFLATFFTLFFEDETGQELVVYTIIVLTLFAVGLIYPTQQYMSAWMGLNGNGLWIRTGIAIAVCLAAVLAGRRRRTGATPTRVGYESVGK